MSKKAEIATANISAACDVFKTKINLSIHCADGHKKLLITVKDGDKNIELSLWKDDAELIGNYINTVLARIDERSLY